MAADSDRALLQLVNILHIYLNTEWTADIHYWNVLIVDEKLCNVLFVIREHLVHKWMFTWKKWTSV